MEHKTKNLIITILIVICLLLIFLLLFCPRTRQAERKPDEKKKTQIQTNRGITGQESETKPVIEEKKIEIKKVYPKIDKPSGKTILIKENKSRKIIRYPLPDCPEWLDEEKTYQIELKLQVTNEGFVKDVEIMKTSGLFELDDYLIKKVREWKFEESVEDIETTVIKIKYDVN
ncbi:MAG TPA: hypothetical protein PKY81_13130 [bacterium]|nr:hypothetical protein [bacterium]HPN31890.1 hypothetical protein [bacterium]